MALVQKKLGNFDNALALWKQATGFGSIAIEAFIEIAKYYEHREKDFATALEYTGRALALLKTKSALHGKVMPDDTQQQLLHRARRLQRKMAK